MKIAYLMGLTVSGSSNGVISQAVTWANGLRSAGHEVALIGPWGNYDWRAFDIIHAFGFGPWLDIVPAIAARTDSKIVQSPIIDTDRNYFLQKCASYCGVRFLHMTSPLHSLRSVRKHISRYYVRSEYEQKYLIKSFDINHERIEKIPLSCRFTEKNTELNAPRENFCLHVSLLSSKNKNVTRLIEAAIKYKFRLVLAGSAGTDQCKREITEIVNNHDNIEYMGFLSDQELLQLYSRARVFALPSLFEGVGLVALEAGALGADIVLTNRGAPKEYYNGLAFLVDPNDVDNIGSTIADVLGGQTYQPHLSNFIVWNNSKERLISILEKSYFELSKQQT